MLTELHYPATWRSSLRWCSEGAAPLLDVSSLAHPAPSAQLPLSSSATVGGLCYARSMTDNNTVDKLNTAQARLTALASSISNITKSYNDLTDSLKLANKTLAEVTTLIESSSHDVSFNEPKAAAKPTTALELLNAFKAAMQAPMDASKALGLSDLTQNPKVVPQAPQPVSTPSQPAKANIFGGNLTEQARELLRHKSYFDTIDALHKMNPQAARDNIRRAVARAQGR